MDTAIENGRTGPELGRDSNDTATGTATEISRRGRGTETETG